jgi:CheY-like chemotaxis protein
MARFRVLATGPEEAVELLHKALGDEVRLIAAQSTAEALQRLDRGIDLIVTNVRVDASRTFRLLRALKLRPESRRLPVVCCQIGKARSPLVRHRIEAAMRSPSAAFVDIHQLTRTYGASVAGEILRQVVIARLHAQRRAAAASPRALHP